MKSVILELLKVNKYNPPALKELKMRQEVKLPFCVSKVPNDPAPCVYPPGSHCLPETIVRSILPGVIWITFIFKPSWRSYLHYKQSFSLEHLECLRDSCYRVCWSYFIFHLWALSYENDPVKSTMHVTWFTNQILHSSWNSRDIDTSKAKFSSALSTWVFRSWDNKQKLPVFFPVRREKMDISILCKTVWFLFLRAMSENLDLLFRNQLHQSRSYFT